VTCDDQRGGGIETSLKGDKQGLGLTTRNKKRFEAQQMLLLGSLAHTVVVWARRWWAVAQVHHGGILRMYVLCFMSVACSASMPSALWLRLF
jgi:hypothetical protein